MFYLGIDVSKAKLDCCLLVDAERLKRRSKSIANSPSGIAELITWVQKHGVACNELHVVMEGTGVYHEQAATALYDAAVQVSIVNPAQVRNFAKGLAVQNKTDAIDSFVLARYGVLLKPAPWSPPPVHARILRSLLARREAIAQDLQRERNRQEKAQACETPALVQQSLDQSIAFLEKQLAQLEQDIDDHIDRHPDLKDDLTLLTSIPAVGPKIGHNLLSVMRCHHFKSAEQLAAYVGLVPVQRQSGTSLLGRAHLSKTGPAHIRAVLYMGAVVAIRHNPHIQALYERLLRNGKAKQAALGAAMRKLVHLCFGVLHSRQPYRPDFVKNP